AASSRYSPTMSQSLAVLPSLRRIYESLGLAPEIISPDELERGLDQLGTRLARLAVEGAGATDQGRRLGAAPPHQHDFPRMRPLPLALRAILTLSLPAPLAAWARQVLDGPDSPIVDDFQRGLATLAAAHDGPPASRALARLFLFEAVRVHLLIAEHLSGSSIA